MKKTIKPIVLISLFFIILIVRWYNIKRKFYLYDKILGNIINIRPYNLPNDIFNIKQIR